MPKIQAEDFAKDSVHYRVTLHSYHFYVAEGLPKTQVLLWVYGEQLRAVFNTVILAAYHGRYDWRQRKVTNIRDGVFYSTRFASPQGSLIALNPQEVLVLYRPRPLLGQARLPFPAQQLMLFELVQLHRGAPNRIQSAELSTDVKDVVARFVALPTLEL